MKRLLSAVAVILLSAPGMQADAPQPPGESTAARPPLKLGDPAPAFKATKWLQGEAVTRFERRRVYVIEFWSTRCGGLHESMPLLTKLQARYKDQGVTIISFTSRDIKGHRGNNEQAVAEFLKKYRPRLSHAFAYAEDGATTEAWLMARGKNGFCTFVVDKSGRIAYMGHPMFLPLVLPRVVAGDASATAIGEAAERAIADYGTMMDGLTSDFLAKRDLKPGLRALKAFEAKYPPLTDMSALIQAKLSLLPKDGEPGEAKAYAEALVGKAIKEKDVRVLEQAYAILRDRTESPELMPIALKAADARLRVDGGGDAESLLSLAETYRVGGDKTKVKECAGRAIELAVGELPEVRQEIEDKAKKFGAGK